MTAVLRPVDRWAGQPAGFNRAAAETVYKALMACEDDETAAIYGRVIVAGMVDHTLLTKNAEITKALRADTEQRASVLRKQLSRSAVVKSRRGEDNTAELTALSVVIKAGFGDESEDQRRINVHREQRDLRTGRFVRSNTPIAYNSSAKDLSKPQAAALGIESHPNLKGKDQARFQQAYAQLDDLLKPLHGMGDGALAHLHIRDKDGNTKTHDMAAPELGGSPKLASHIDASKGEYLHSVSLSVIPPMSASGAAYDAMAGVSPTAASIGYNTVQHGAGDTERLRRFRTDPIHGIESKDANGQDDFIPSQRVFRHLENGSKLLNDSLGDVAPRKVQYALKVGEHVGRYGPEAQRVVGPTADKAAYRFRGTERPLPEGIRNALLSVKNMNISPEAKRRYLLHGNAKPDGSTPASQWQPSGLMLYLNNGLPKADLNTLHLHSGAVPPSKGIVFDKSGNAHVESVGYGDDHYLPFNLKGKAFRSLKGGEYIRTRTFGGPTTEDIHAGLLGGATSLAVVSHSGVYTVDFAPDLTGGKRFNDNAIRMVGRYGHLLDAVQSRQVVTGNIARSRMDEIEAAANQVAPEDLYPDKYKAELDRRTAWEMAHPTLSQRQRDQAVLDFYSDEIPGGRGVGDARQALLSQYVDTEAQHRFQHQPVLHPDDPRNAVPQATLPEIRRQVASEIGDKSPAQVAEMLADLQGRKPALDAAIKQAEQENAASLSPLRLDGQGYKKALDALQEEFPHYITSVEYHPWPISLDPARGRRDTGYVKPRHNRAAEALAGYFGAGIGSPKVYADSTRWQNRNGTLREYKPKLGRGTPVQPQAVPNATATSQGSSAQAPAAPTEGQRRAADHALIDELFAARERPVNPHHGPIGTAEAGALAPRGQVPMTPRQALSSVNGQLQLSAAAPNLTDLWNLGNPEAARAAYDEDPVEYRRKLTSAVGENKRLNLLSVDKGKVGSFERGGAPEPAKPLATDFAESLRHRDSDINFGPEASPYLEPNNDVTSGDVANAYAGDYHVAPLVRRGELPADITDPTFRTKVDSLLARLTEEHRQHRAIRDAGRVVPPADATRVAIDSNAALRANQYGRRHEEAVKREAAPLTRTTPTEPESKVENHIHIEGGEDGLNALAARLGLGPVARDDDDRTIHQ